MVFVTLRYFSQKALKAGTFIDSLRLSVIGGAGGMGQPKYGGIGGRGGNVVLVADEEITLMHVLKKNSTRLIKAISGENSHAHKLVGDPGPDSIVHVPVGVSVYSQGGIKIGDLNNKDDKLIVARGGIGGQQITEFNGLKGEENRVVLDLKLIADVGLVGFPNAGKSSLLRAISRASPRIADYPFTTLKPQIGTVKFEDLRQITIADLPGLIEGAHNNAGLGYRFLKHVERTQILILMIDINGFRLSHKYPHRTPLETLALLNKELELYGRNILSKPAVLLVNKMDMEGAEQKWQKLEPLIRRFEESVRSLPEKFQPEEVMNFEEIIKLSVQKDAQGVKRLAERIRQLIDVQAELKLNAGYSDKMALEIRERNREQKIQQASAEHQSNILA